MAFSVQRSITTKYQATSVVSTNISRRLNASSDLEKFAQGINDEYIPKTLAEYKQYRRFAHDILCLGLIAGNFFDSEEFDISKINLVSNDPKLILQKPDLYTVEMSSIKLCEVSLTYDYETMDLEKSNKYNDLIMFIENNSKYKVTYTTMIVDLTDAEWEDSIPQIPENHKSLLNRFVQNLITIHSTHPGTNFRKALSQNILIDFPFSYDEDHIMDYMKGQLNIKQPIDKNLFSTYTKGFGKLDVSSKEVTEYLDKLSDEILVMDKHRRPFPNNSPKDQIDFKSEWADYLSNPSTTNKLPVILQLGMPNLTEEIETPSKPDIYMQLKESRRFGGYLDLIKSSKTTVDELLNNNIIRLNLTEQQLNAEMMDGPGRKKYLKQNNIKMDRKAPTHISPSVEHINQVNELMDIINELNPEDFLIKRSFADYNVCGNNLGSSVNYCINKLKQNGSDYLLQFYSRISTEIILNSMRRRKSREYVLCSSGFRDVYFIIAPGPQLRTESNVEFIKIISLVEPIYHKLSREWKLIGDHWESDWLSVDTDRVKHWARSRDRTNLSIIGSADRLMRPGLTLSQCLNEEINNSNYSLLTLIYLENKSSTSTTIQTTRYFLMKCLGDRDLKGLMSKFPERVNSTIQSLVLQRTYNFVNDICSKPTEDFVKLQHIKRDENIGSLDETTTGVTGSIPRIFTSGNYVPIKYSINEIYWCMTYNKDRQNQTQDAMKILKKIAKEERKFDEEISLRDDNHKLAHAFGFHTLKEDIQHITSTNPESHYFSALAVHIGIALQDVHPENFAPNSSWLSYTKINDILNKNLSEYATFKASVNSIKDQVMNDDLKELKEIGRRTKCIELIYEIVSSEKLIHACDVAMSFSGSNSINFNVVIQIFKKNQVGGVREILILFIKARILINLTEEISRLLSKSDKRETLTKGRDKRLMMRGDYEELSSSFPSNTPLYVIKNSYDMSTWCQKFIPTIFLPIYNHHKDSLKEMIDLCRFVMLKHCQKEIEYPNKLVTEWVKYPSYKHSEPFMQYYKEKFLSDRQPKMRNFSNMGQGILHYNSTVLALSCQSLRDKLFDVCLKKLGRPCAIKWKTRVGSDDKGDTIFCDMSKDDYLSQAQLFEQCSSVSERLHAMELSTKSASGNIIYEFNSAYMANLEVQSPIIKFTLAAVDMIGTDSCTDFVNESYSRIRQLRENGANSLICYLSHLYNKDHFNEIFRTGSNMQNDPESIFNIKSENIPYDLGVYPIYDCDVQDMIGPEFHNYQVFTNSTTPESILRLLYTSHFDLKESSIIPDDDEGMFKKDDFRIAQGMVRQLSNMRERLQLSKEEIQSYLEENPFLIIRGPMTVKETAILIASKLYTRGASKSLRRTSPAIYMGRLSAFESARAWNTFLNYDESGSQLDEPKIIKLTFREYISTLYESAKKESSIKANSLREFKALLFPQYNSFDVVKQYVSNFGIRKESHKMFSQSIRTWILNNFNYNFSNSLKAILETSFGMSTKATRDDVMELRKAIPFDITTYESFMENCRESHIRPLDLFFYLNKFYKNSNLKRAQVFATGPSTSSLNLTLSNLKRYNHLTGSIMEIETGLDLMRIETSTTLERDFEIMKLSFNMIMLETQDVVTYKDVKLLSKNVLQNCSLNDKSLYDLTETIIRNIRSISGFDNHIKRIIILLASYVLTKSEFLSRLISWKQFSYNYTKRQKKSLSGDWYGDLSVIVNMSNECFTVNQVGKYRFIETMRISNPNDFNAALKRIFKILNFTETDFSTISTAKPGDWYFSNNMIYESRAFNRLKQRMNIHFIPTFKYRKLTDMTNFNVDYKSLKTGATTISLNSKTDSNNIEVAHFPGHYYPVEIPHSMKLESEMFINGLRATKLLKNRKWFFDGRLYPFNSRGSVDILKNHLDLENMSSIISNNRSRLEEYINDMEYDQEEIYEEPINNDIISDVQLQRDLIRQSSIVFNSISLKEMFSKAVQDLQDEDAEYLTKNTDVPLSEQFKDDTGIENFVRALGENKLRKKKDFYMITNLRLNVNFINRVLDLFFKGNSIMSETSRELPNYALHCRSVRQQPECDTKLIDMLHNYICSRISILVGRDFDYIVSQINQMEGVNRNFNTLPKLNSYLTSQSPTLFEMLDQGMFEGQDSDSEGELD